MNIKHLLAASTLLISANCFAQSTFEEGGLMYMEDLSDPSKMAVIVMPKTNLATYQNMYSGNIIVPASIEHDLDTYEVVGLATGCFAGPNITGIEIKIPLKVLSVGCIYGDKIKNLKFPDTLEEIPSGPASPNIEELYLGKNLKTIDASFMYLNILSDLQIPSTIESIKSSFDECGKIKTLNLKGGNLSTLSFSFKAMPALESLSIEGKNLIIRGCFDRAGQLHTLNLSGIRGIKGSFNESNIDKLVIPEGVTEIYGSFKTFNGTELTLPNSLTKLERSFDECPNLKVAHLSKGVCSVKGFCKGKGETLYCPWDEVPAVPYFKSNPEYEVTFVVPVGMEAKYREAWAKKLQYVKGNVTFREEKF